MTIHARLLRREQLDAQLSRLREEVPVGIPKGGWVRAIREALGLTLDGLGKRLGVSRQTAFQLEASEVNGSLTLKRLRAAADALNCDVAVLLVPRDSLEATLRAKALEAAGKSLQRVGHTMDLEAQTISPDRMQEMVRRKADEMVEKGDPRIWE